MSQKKAIDVLIIGAGAAGMMAAKELSSAGRNVLVLEARSIVGGRIHTYTDPAFTQPIELGAEFVHGHLPLTLSLLDAYGIGYTPVSGSLWQSKKGSLHASADFIDAAYAGELEKQLRALEHDTTVDAFLHTYFSDDKYSELRKSVTGFVSGYDAADVKRASTFAFRDEWLQGGDTGSWEQYRVTGGYHELIFALERDAVKNGASIHLSNAVQEIRWKKKNVQVLMHNGQTYEAKQALITVPLGVLALPESEPGHIRFVPPLPQQQEAVQALGFGDVIKVVLQFSKAFWTSADVQEQTGKNLSDMGFLFTDGTVPTWWTQLPQQDAILTGWIASSAIDALEDRSPESVLTQALSTLASAFGVSAEQLSQQLSAHRIIHWKEQPYARGAYSYQTVDAAQFRRQLAAPVSGTLFFAGEATYTGEHMATVEAALVSGKDAAAHMLDS